MLENVSCPPASLAEHVCKHLDSLHDIQIMALHVLRTLSIVQTL